MKHTSVHVRQIIVTKTKVGTVTNFVGFFLMSFSVSGCQGKEEGREGGGGGGRRERRSERRRLRVERKIDLYRTRRPSSLQY